MDIIFVNKIEEQVNKYIDKTGSNKTWVAKQIGMSKQSLYNLFQSTQPSINNLIKLSIILNCDIKELYEYKQID